MKVIIIGGGQVGAYIAKLLLKNNCSVKVIENNSAVFAKIKQDLPKENIVFGSGTDPNILETCGIAEADVVCAVTGADETNLVASTIAKFEFDVPRVIARINNPKNAWMFDAGMGVDAALNQADMVAHLVIEEMDFNNLLTLLKINKADYSIIQIHVEELSEAVGKTVKDLGVPTQAVLIAVYRGTEVIIPRDDTVITTGDDILAFANRDSQIFLSKKLGAGK